MDSASLLAELEELLAREEAHKREVEQSIKKLKGLRDRLAHELPVANVAGVLGEPRTQFERIVTFFRTMGGMPQTTKAIMNATGISRSSLSQLLYRTHRDFFVPTASPGYSRKKLWTLSEEAAAQSRVAWAQPNLFGIVGGDLAGFNAKDCCQKILEEHDNLPMNALTLAREALARGYTGAAEGTPDDVLMTTAKSFWARLCRDEKFVEIRPQVFVLREPPSTPIGEDEV
jgi:hypothetical protein